MGMTSEFGQSLEVPAHQSTFDSLFAQAGTEAVAGVAVGQLALGAKHVLRLALPAEAAAAPPAR